MEARELQQALDRFLDESPTNYVPESEAMRPDLVGMRIYESSLVGVAAHDAPEFREFLKEDVIGPFFMLPDAWVDGAQSVISFFFSFTKQVKESNRARSGWWKIDDFPKHNEGGPYLASEEWIHARIEGQETIVTAGEYICDLLRDAGYQVAFPTTDERFAQPAPLTSNWSERHVAYACGLGTFGMSRGLITAKGMAGRLGSVITDVKLEPTPHDYSGPFDYCTMCGSCAEQCPVDAIDSSRGVIEGKSQAICAPFIFSTFFTDEGGSRKRRYGCGKCQVGVPCQDGIPKRKAPAGN